MASTAGQSNQTWQDKYATNMKLAYALITNEDTMRVLSYTQKNQSEGHEKYVFYKTGRLASRTKEDTYNGTDYNYNVITGQDITDFGKAVSVVPTPNECPFWRGKYDDILTQVGIEGNLIIGSRSAMYKSTITKILAPLLAYTVTGDFTQYDNKGVGTLLTIPAGQKYGDITKSFYEVEEDFLDMLAELEVLSSGEGMKVNVAMLLGTKGMKVLKGYDRTSNMDYITTDNFKTKLGNKLAIKKFDIAELIPMSNFDATFGAVGRIVIILDRALGYDTNKTLDTVAVQLDHRGAKFFNSTVFDACTIVDEEGVFIFEFDGTLGSRIHLTQTVV